MIEREGHDWVVVCDRCLDGGRIDRRQLGHGFRRLLELVMAAGWFVFRRTGGWIHVCPRCAGREISGTSQPCVRVE